MPRGGRERGYVIATAASDGVMGAAAHGVRQGAGNQLRRPLMKLPNHLVYCPAKFRMDCELRRGGGNRYSDALEPPAILAPRVFFFVEYGV